MSKKNSRFSDNNFEYDLVHLLVTNKCNLTCRHCLASSGPPDKDELSVDEMIRVVGQLNDISYKDIHFEGGEPFVRKGFEAILDSFDTLENATIITNGTVPYDERFDVLRKKKINSVMFSLDNFGRPIRGRYKKILPNLLEFKKNEIPVKIRTTINRGNIDFMEKIIKIALDIGVIGIRFGAYKVLGRGKDAGVRDKYAFDDESYANLFDVFGKLIERYGSDILMKLSTPAAITTSKDGYKIYEIAKQTDSSRYTQLVECFAFERQFNIFSNGDVSACNECPYQVVLGNVRKNTLKSIVAKTRIRRDIFQKQQHACHGHVLVSSDKDTYDMQ